MIPDPEFPAPVVLEANIPYVRSVLTTVQNTWTENEIVPVQSLGASASFFGFQNLTRGGAESQVASHAVIDQAAARLGRDYRFETAPHPVRELRSRTQDNTAVGRDPAIPGYNRMTPAEP